MGFGPFRWVCCSGLTEDLRKTDQIAMNVIENLLNQSDEIKQIKQQYEDNLEWIRKAEHHRLVVGSQARILYADQKGRVKIALAFNKAIKDKVIQVINILNQ